MAQLTPEHERHPNLVLADERIPAPQPNHNPHTAEATKIPFIHIPPTPPPISQEEHDYLRRRLEESDFRVEPFSVPAQVTVRKEGASALELTPSETIEVRKDLRVVEELIAELWLMGTTGDWKLDYDLWYTYKKLKELSELEEYVEG